MNDNKEYYHSDAEDISIFSILQLLIDKDLRRVDGEIKFRDKIYKYSAYTIDSPGSFTYRMDIREVTT